ncbi:structural maintenance of chromosomes protein 2 [Diprion similis]|uniref:structural maintenance of chromosomes protein 2 n=1 Tax=Diprion similis TaxID=362088 RepID=UPI001EF77AB1|nr:structural maintenance of chromosomes protein 2 [Diprion similis]
MYVKSMVIDGFKSYGKRVEVNGFDKEFNAITGLNGSGKSNVLDAICFVLGITNLSQIRATSLQDLVYKSGQAGVTKASVTITFDNRDRSSSPMGYEDYEEITVTRQVQIGGKNKYMINGSTVQNKRAHDMFCSVQLNVNNPHFLIMQGRITKVLNMKPVEILSMIEEAAGTSLYENKKNIALKTIEKKDSKLKEITSVIKEVLEPRLRKLKDQKSQYLEFQRVERELDHCHRIYIAWEYVSTLEKITSTADQVNKVQSVVQAKQKAIDDGAQEIVDIDQRMEEIHRARDADRGNKLEEIESELKSTESQEHKLSAEANSTKESIEAETKLVGQLKTNIKDDEAALTTKEKELAKVGELFRSLKAQCEEDSALYQAAQERYEKVSSGLLLSEDGENATLEQQLMNAKQQATKAKTEIKQCQMTLKHSKEQLAKKQSEMGSTEIQYKKDSKNLEEMEKELKSLQSEIDKLDYNEASRETLQEEVKVLSRNVATLRSRSDNFEARHSQLRFQYQDPEPNFDRNSVKGLVCKLFTVKDSAAATALETAAGGRLFNVVVDTETTSKKLLQRGQLQQRVTIIPLNKISGRAMDPKIVKLAESVGGKGNVQTALSLIDYPPEVAKAMNWIFGQIFVCKDMETAQKVTFHERIMKKCVTLEGDVFDPAGTLSGGASSKTGSLLLQLDELKTIQKNLNEDERSLAEINRRLTSSADVAKKFQALKQRFDLRNHEVELVRQRLQQTSHHKLRQEVEMLKSTIEEATQTLETAKRVEADSTKRANDIEGQLKDAVNIRERQLKAVEMEMKDMKQKSTKSREQWQRREQESETLNLEITELRKAIQTGKEQLVAAEEKLAKLKEASVTRGESLAEIREHVKALQTKIKMQKEAINQKNKEIQKLLNRKEEIGKQKTDFELEIQKLNHEIAAIQGTASESESRIKALTRKYDWIEKDKAYFGTAGGIYDFNADSPTEIGRRISQLQKEHDKLSRNINTRAMDLLSREEEEYSKLMKKKQIVESDKKKILEAINELDEKKKEILVKACKQVNKDFGSIFSTLLPGADAKLEPPENKTYLDGLEVKIGFSGIWKESLSELSGGQRSLIALSLILAMLLFKPAPLYILDEVDAALDLSHTQNIGSMLKRHFTQSQFIIVSLKDGMFNNANVLFRTKFIDGFSAVVRTASTSAARKN